MTEVEGVVVRPLRAADEPEWQILWAGYLTFYRQRLSAETTQATWRALIDPGRPEMIGRVAALGGRVVGMLNAVIHPNTWSIAPVCYLEDLYVEQGLRGRGIGRSLMRRSPRRAGAPAGAASTGAPRTTISPRSGSTISSPGAPAG